jgi:hypothetical protein
MSKSENHFSFFSSFIVRTPSYPINFYLNLTKGLHIERNNIIEFLSDNRIKDSLFLASPDFYDEICKWIANEDHHPEKANKIKLSILKYLIRMSTRCTPFGLFSACGSGKLSNESLIVLNTGVNYAKKTSFYRKTRLDTQFLENLGNEYINNSIIQSKLLFYTNNTLYKLGKYYRYVEFTLNENKRKYSLQAIKRTHYLDLILQKASTGLSKNDLVATLVAEEINEIESTKFVEELISNRILVSELELTLTGDDFLIKLIEHIHTIKNREEIGISKEMRNEFKKKQEKILNLILNLPKLTHQISEIDKTDPAIFPDYKSITKTILETQVPFDQKYLLQTDLFLDSRNFRLSEKYTNKVKKVIEILNNISKTPQNSSLENFKKRFLQRYDSETVPLVKALDVETGIGYLYDNSFDVNPILDSININRKSEINGKVNLTKIEEIIYNKLQETISKNESSFTLNYSDFDIIDFKKEDLPSTFSCLFEIIEEDGKEWIVIQHIGGSSAANLLARFCYGNEQIADLANEITEYELNFFNDKIVAEIVHLPAARTGNILRRPNFRTYEIPYLAHSSLPRSHQITIDDLMLCVKNDRLIIWSKKYKKEIIPKLTNAHNFSSSALPVYNFLCDMQFENCKSLVGLDLDNLEKFFDYFPRITIGDCIISKARWIFNKETKPYIFKAMDKKSKDYDINIFSKISAICNNYSKSLPHFVSFIDGDNTLTINMQNSTCIEMLTEIVKNRSQFVLEEYLFPSKSLITDEQNYYGNQFIVGVKWNEK